MPTGRANSGGGRAGEPGHSHSRSRWSGTGGPFGRANAREVVDELILTAAHADCEGMADSELAAMTGLLAAGAGFERGREIVAGRLEELLRSYVVLSLRRGWEPVDLHQVLRRKVSSDASACALGAIRDVWAGAAAPGVRDRWEEQVEGPLAEARLLALDPAEASWPDALAAALRALGFLVHLPGIPDLASFGERSGDRSAGDPGGIGDPAILAKVRSMLAKAESSEFPEEADTFMAKAQELIARHNLERAIKGAGEESGRGRVAARRVWVDDPYLPAKCLLLSVVAEANRCKAVASTRLGFVTVVGHPDDLEGSEVLFTSLLVQATRRMSALSRQAPGGASSPKRARRPSYRRSFLVAFATRIGERLAAANEVATGEAEAASGGALLPVLARRRGDVEDAVGDLFPGIVHSNIGVSDLSGWAAGTAAADLADLVVQGQLPSEECA